MMHVSVLCAGFFVFVDFHNGIPHSLRFQIMPYRFLKVILRTQEKESAGDEKTVIKRTATMTSDELYEFVKEKFASCSATQDYVDRQIEKAFKEAGV